MTNMFCLVTIINKYKTFTQRRAGQVAVAEVEVEVSLYWDLTGISDMSFMYAGPSSRE